MGGGGTPTPSYIPQSAPAAVQAEAVQAEKKVNSFESNNQSILAASNQSSDITTGTLGLGDNAKLKRKNLLGG